MDNDWSKYSNKTNKNYTILFIIAFIYFFFCSEYLLWVATSIY